MKFTKFIHDLFLAEEKPEEKPVVENTEDKSAEGKPTEDPEKEKEELAEEPTYVTAEELEALVTKLVAEALESITEAKAEMSLAAEKQSEEVKGLVTKIEALELELQKPGKEPEVIVPKTNGKVPYFSLADEVKKNMKKL